MLEMVKARRESDKVEERYDLFSGLLDAAQDEQGGEVVLNDDELMGGCSMSRSFEIHASSCLTRPPRKHVYLSYCWSRGAIFLFFLRCCAKTVLCRPQRIHYASHLLCWLFILTSKSVCINISKVLCPA